ncbi:MAG: TldD/PmbA family protein [Ferroplasma sp.]|uniref:TldD/PmbA family protein n=1 Tax=Ferroplasma sp. TaxID=2591003 RepID=UPI0028149E84|nr:TldD/PmbA family protein [Ferroplasma sp.]WMT50891.1 MAG: TldD/PmbA family protein [Ferroplasma sp.]
MEIDKFVKNLGKICDEFAINVTDGTTEEVRFSENTIDLDSEWSNPSYTVFAARGKKIVETSLDSLESWEGKLRALSNMLENAPENPDFYGINPVKFSYHNIQEYRNADIHGMAGDMIHGARDGGADRAAGLIYLHNLRNRVITPWNDQEYSESSLELVVRAFKGSNSGQEALHYGMDSMESANPYGAGMSAARTATLTDKKASIDEGKYDVIFSPYTMGTVLSYNMEFLSYYSINAGLSPFLDRAGQVVASKNVTIFDDPLDKRGAGFTPVDQEGTATSRVNLIENGILKGYLHSYSTGRQSGNQSTGNAGIIQPMPWQIHMAGGSGNPDDMIAGMKKGLLINNSWYARFQDESNGTFSTVPRDGIFLIENGEVSGSLEGIRISDSILNILMHVRELSREEKYVKWWDEIHASIMPYALVENVNISKGF